MTASIHILVVDDDSEIRDLLKRFLARSGFRVTSVADGAGMRSTLAQGGIDLIVLDVMMPGEDGLTLCRQLRAKSVTPIIMLTAMGDETDRIVGLEMGADDYLAKPFNPRELLARIKAVLRRSGQGVRAGTGSVLGFDGWKIDLTKRELVSPKGELVDLTGGEFDLLVAFAEHPQRTLSRDQLLDLTRGRMGSPYDRSIDIQVSRLRQKMGEDAKESKLIKTVRSIGYIFSTKVTVS
ncbi:MAG: response regulator [Tagaea sp.]|jgi:two-component system, OmpR family, response regulator|nr:response regulator [Tagaea sp.]